MHEGWEVKKLGSYEAEKLVHQQIHSTSKTIRFNLDWRMIDNKVPVRISLWLGTGIVIVEAPIFFAL